MDYEIMLTIK